MEIGFGTEVITKQRKSYKIDKITEDNGVTYYEEAREIRPGQSIEHFESLPIRKFTDEDIAYVVVRGEAIPYRDYQDPNPAVL